MMRGTVDGAAGSRGSDAARCGGRARGGRWRQLALPLALVVLGLLVSLAPVLLDLSTSRSAHEEISQMESSWSASDDDEAERAWAQARAYNRALAGKKTKGISKILPYGRQLACGGLPCICYLQIESVGIELPVYRGVSEKSLSSGAGHLERTSLPVGGKGSNCCISAHSGVASGSMFDGLRDVGIGDYVALRTLGRELGYRVADVEVVDQSDTSALRPREGRDLLTLVTCTSDPTPGMPRGGYGVNDRRLVVTCERCSVPVPGAAQVVGRAHSPANERWWPAALAGGLALVAALSALAAARANRGRHERKDKDQRAVCPQVKSEEEI